MKSKTFEDRISELRLEHYILEHSEPEPQVLSALSYMANQQLTHPRMVSGHLQGRLLKMLVRMIRPHRILELGTYAAYATICLAEALEGEARVVTVELEDELEPFIRTQLANAGVEERVDLVIGDALEVLGRLDLSQFDLVYMDANKRQYPEYYDMLIQGLKSGAFILADNTLWDGKITDESAHDAQTEGIRAFNDLLVQDERVEQVILPLRDGLTLIYVK